MQSVSSQLESTLTKIIHADEQISKVILVDRTGLTISHISRSREIGAIDVDGIGAIASAVFCASEEQGNNLEIGKLNIVSSEFISGKIFAGTCGRGVLCIITGHEVNIGMVRLVLKQATEKLSKVLDQFLAGYPDGVSVAEGGQAGSKPSLEKDELEAALRELEKF